MFKEAKDAGFDVKGLRQVIRLRKQDAAEREEQDAMRDTYCRALGSERDQVQLRRPGRRDFEIVAEFGGAPP